MNNKLWLRFGPLAAVILVNIAFMLEWINQSTWLILLAVSFAAHVFLSIKFFKYRREIFLANRQEAERQRARADAPE